MKAILNKYIYKSNKEFYSPPKVGVYARNAGYDCKLNKIIDAISNCLKIEKKCVKCNDIINQIGGENITDILIEKYKNKDNNYKHYLYTL